MLCFTAKNIIFIKNSEVKNHFAEKLLFYYLFFLLNKASLITLLGSFINNIIIQTMRPNAIIEKPKNASFSISSGAGVKFRLQLGVLKNRINEPHNGSTPKEIARNVKQIFFCSAQKYQTAVEIIAANTLISNVIIPLIPFLWKFLFL